MEVKTMLRSIRSRAQSATVVPAPEDPFDRRGYYRSPVTFAGYRRGHEPANKGRKFPVEVLTGREVLAIVSACGKGYAGVRNRALIVLMWRTGLRVAEALALQPRDLDLDRGTVHVRHGKGDKSRTVGIDPAAAAVIRQWITARAELGAGRTDPVFCVISKPTIGQPMHAAYVRNMVKECADRAGVEKRVHPHAFRHTCAYDMFSEGVRIDMIQRQLGHGDLATTSRYLAHLNPAELIDAVQARAWPEAA